MQRHYRSIIDLMKEKPKETVEDEDVKQERLYDNLFSIMREKRISYLVGTRCMKQIENEDQGDEKPLIKIPVHGVYAFSTLLVPLELGLRLIVNSKEWPIEFESELLTPTTQKATETSRTQFPTGKKVYFTWKEHKLICELLLEPDPKDKSCCAHLTLCLQSED